jgi:hypothetical protein
VKHLLARKKNKKTVRAGVDWRDFEPSIRICIRIYVTAGVVHPEAAHPRIKEPDFHVHPSPKMPDATFRDENKDLRGMQYP